MASQSSVTLSGVCLCLRTLIFFLLSGLSATLVADPTQASRLSWIIVAPMEITQSSLKCTLCPCNTFLRQRLPHVVGPMLPVPLFPAELWAP
jgi:hypothetical protein